MPHSDPGNHSNCQKITKNHEKWHFSTSRVTLFHQDLNILDQNPHPGHQFWPPSYMGWIIMCFIIPTFLMPCIYGSFDCSENDPRNRASEVQPKSVKTRQNDEVFRPFLRNLCQKRPLFYPEIWQNRLNGQNRLKSLKMDYRAIYPRTEPQSYRPKSRFFLMIFDTFSTPSGGLVRAH